MSALPSQSRYIIGTEACERFSFYGMNTAHLPIPDTWFPTLISVMVTAAVALLLLRNKNK